jgi:hypothetical protein
MSDEGAGLPANAEQVSGSIQRLSTCVAQT